MLKQPRIVSLLVILFVVHISCREVFEKFSYGRFLDRLFFQTLGLLQIVS